MAWQRALGVLLFLVCAPFAGGLLGGLDRKLSARLQGRQGPPVLQPFYDVYKLFHKQTIVVNRLQDFLVGGYFIFSIFTGCLFFSGGDLLLAFFALTLAEIFLFMAACSANSPYSSMGAQRELVQIMSYEPMLLLAAIGLYMITGSFFIDQVADRGISAIAFLPGMFFGLVFVFIIKFRKSPFDISASHHAHQEIVKGLTTELSGSELGLVEVAGWYEDVLLLGLLALFILNRNPWSILAGVATGLACYFLLVLVDNLFPRVRWEKMLNWAWAVTLIFGGTNLLVLALVL
ncbi:MAG TPA: Ech hydrogenase subunit EchB [Ruminococcaceae bacterium]|jgi:ech hydrogenase subunit B|nr:Ech hydrogenase subunit EchB [Oscillospiraceae bacterium]HBQ46276.1 Ech hydrogenase subunit EchB [Oscillospiraceae bacterium]HBT91206.1 Ech hydrogenase subunit EchB [Oscillospiraceae bacterium]HCB92098.1 Ech hydrogenase subunit EchB [Oscillospiraceae bacterium]